MSREALPPDSERSRTQLVALLKLAYSGEKAAAYAYFGHAASVRDPGERERIKMIEEEEWQHRSRIGELLRELGETPSRALELRASAIGRTLAFLCHCSGWLLPMYGAGRLESRNIREYESAARHARACGREEWVDCLLTMAEVEWEHEAWFRSRVLSHPLGKRARVWPEPPPKRTIRDSMPPRPRPADDSTRERRLASRHLTTQRRS